MTDYTKLIKELRETAKHLDGISRFPYDDDPAKRIYSKKMADAADAIEALQAQLPKRGEIVRCKECRWGHLCVTGQHLGLDGFCSKGEREVQE